MSQEHWRQFIAFAPVAIAMLDRRLRYLAASGRWMTDVIKTAEDVIGRSHYEVSSEIPDHWKAVHRRCLQGATEHHDGELFVRADGKRQWIRWAVQPWFTTARAIGGLVIFAEDITERKEAEAALRQSRDALEVQATELQRRTDQLRRLASALTVAEQRAREQLARTLHDGLQQLLFSAALKLQRLTGDTVTDPAAAQRLLAQAGDDVTRAIAVSRTLAVELFPPSLHAEGLPASLSWLVDWMAQQYGLHVDLTADPEANPEDKNIRTLVFESVRELLFNIVKHAKTDRATVDLRLTSEDLVRVTVTDRGVGFDAATILGGPAHGFGLFSVRERLALFGGQMDAVSIPGSETRVVLAVSRGSA